MFTLRGLLTLTYILLTLQADTPINPATKTFQPFGDNSYNLSWNIDEAAGLINMTLDCATTGWVGIGLSDTGMMANSDLVVCWITPENVPTCFDGHAVGYSFNKDEANGGTNDLSGVTGSVISGRSVVSFAKKLNSGDSFDKVISKGSDMRVLFSYRTEGNPSTENGQFNEHSIKVMKSLVLWTDGLGSTAGYVSYSYLLILLIALLI
jgi:hypothetical protein